MYRILIIDDFTTDRESLKEIIKTFDDMEVVIAGECENGLEALNFLRKSPVEIIICDIEMPFVNGLEFAKMISKEYPSIKLIFYTLYDEFKYAKQALYLNCYGYVLKPANPAELKKCINNAIRQLSNELQNANGNEKLTAMVEESIPVLADSLLKEIIYGTGIYNEKIWERIKFLKINLIEGFFQLVFVEIDDYEKITSSYGIEQKHIFSYRVYEKLTELIDPYGNAVMTRLDDYHFLIILNLGQAKGAKELVNQARECGKKIASEFCNSDISLSIALSSPSDKISEIKNLYDQCIYIMRHKYTLGKGKLITDEDIPSNVVNPGIDFNSIQKETRYLMNSGTKQEIEQYFDSLFEGDKLNISQDYAKNLCFTIVICIQFVLNENGDSYDAIFDDEKLIWEKLLKFETIQDVKVWLKNIFVFVHDHLLQKVKSNHMLLAEKVKSYIRDNLSNNIGLETIATDFFYSPNYLNYTFKQETGETIMDYILKAKIEKAKELLLDKRQRIYDISGALGYCHSAYFCSMFKKYTGLTPKEYRERSVL